MQQSNFSKLPQLDSTSHGLLRLSSKQGQHGDVICDSASLADLHRGHLVPGQVLHSSAHCDRGLVLFQAMAHQAGHTEPPKMVTQFLEFQVQQLSQGATHHRSNGIYFTPRQSQRPLPRLFGNQLFETRFCNVSRTAGTCWDL